MIKEILLFRWCFSLKFPNCCDHVCLYYCQLLLQLKVLCFTLRCGEKDFLDNVVKKVVTAKDINHKGQGVWVTMRKLHGDLKQVGCRSNSVIMF